MVAPRSGGAKPRPIVRSRIMGHTTSLVAPALCSNALSSEDCFLSVRGCLDARLNAQMELWRVGGEVTQREGSTTCDRCYLVFLGGRFCASGRAAHARPTGSSPLRAKAATRALAREGRRPPGHRAVAVSPRRGRRLVVAVALAAAGSWRSEARRAPGWPTVARARLAQAAAQRVPAVVDAPGTEAGEEPPAAAAARAAEAGELAATRQVGRPAKTRQDTALRRPTPSETACSLLAP